MSSTEEQAATSSEALAQLWRLAGLAPAVLDDVHLTGREPVFPSTFAVGTAALPLGTLAGHAQHLPVDDPRRHPHAHAPRHAPDLAFGRELDVLRRELELGAVIRLVERELDLRFDIASRHRPGAPATLAPREPGEEIGEIHVLEAHAAAEGRGAVRALRAPVGGRPELLARRVPAQLQRRRLHRLGVHAVVHERVLRVSAADGRAGEHVLHGEHVVVRRGDLLRPLPDGAQRRLRRHVRALFADRIR